MATVNPNAHMLGGYSDRDGTIAFYGRVYNVVDQNSRVLDLGAGRGGWANNPSAVLVQHLRTFKGRCREYVGADIDVAVVSNPTTDANFVLPSTGQLPFDDEYFDVVLADFVLEHVQEPTKFISEVARVLAPGGHFCARTPHELHYVSLGARLTNHSTHKALLKHFQPRRDSVDVFPTRYALNTLKRVRQSFPGWHNHSYIYRTEPSYYGGTQGGYRIMNFIHHIAPLALVGNLFILVRKPEEL